MTTTASIVNRKSNIPMTALSALAPTHAALASHHASRITHHASPTMFKYIILEHPDGHEVPIVFDRSLQHRDAFSACLKPVSAGFCMLYQGQLHVPQVGSDTLNLDPRPQDTTILRQFLGLVP